MMENIPNWIDYPAGAALIVAPVLAFIVGMAYFGGYPGFSQWWLTNVVAPTFVTMVALVAGFAWWLDWPREKRSREST